MGCMSMDGHNNDIGDKSTLCGYHTICKIVPVVCSEFTTFQHLHTPFKYNPVVYLPQHIQTDTLDHSPPTVFQGCCRMPPTPHWSRKGEQRCGTSGRGEWSCPAPACCSPSLNTSCEHLWGSRGARSSASPCCTGCKYKGPVTQGCWDGTMPAGAGQAFPRKWKCLHHPPGKKKASGHTTH